ncbi:MAG: hypothetical protein ACTSRZ_03440 [Promethearchaeota archaeon]
MRTLATLAGYIVMSCPKSKLELIEFKFLNRGRSAFSGSRYFDKNFEVPLDFSNYSDLISKIISEPDEIELEEEHINPKFFDDNNLDLFSNIKNLKLSRYEYLKDRLENVEINDRIFNLLRDIYSKIKKLRKSISNNQNIKSNKKKLDKLEKLLDIIIYKSSVVYLQNLRKQAGSDKEKKKKIKRVRKFIASMEKRVKQDFKYLKHLNRISERASHESQQLAELYKNNKFLGKILNLNYRNCQNKVTKRSKYIARCVVVELIRYCLNHGYDTIVLEKLGFSSIKGFQTSEIKTYIESLAKTYGIKLYFVNATGTSQEWYKDNLNLLKKVKPIMKGFIWENKFILHNGGDYGKYNLKSKEVCHRDLGATAAIMARYAKDELKIVN